jgi:hypothetical protein
VSPEIRQRAITAGIGTTTDTEVAERMGVTRERVRQIRNAMGLPCMRDAMAAVRHRETTEARASIVRSAVAKNVPVAHVARELGMSEQTLYVAAREAGVRMRRGPPPKFDWDAVDWTRRNVDITRDLGCSRNAVSRERKRRREHGIPTPPAPERSIRRAVAS